jgi:diguanylate cyclase (GGDEF)-like protein
MKFSKKDLKIRTKGLFEIIGQYIQRHNILLLVLLSLILALNIAFTIIWYHLPEEVEPISEIAFYIAQGFMFLATSLGIVYLALSKKLKIPGYIVAIANHIYAAFFVAWATIVFCYDAGIGYLPLTFLLVMTFVAAVFVIDPFYFVFIEALSLIPIFIVVNKNKEIFFDGKFYVENIIIFISFLIVIAFISFRNYRVILSSFKVDRKLRELSYKDELTGLLNERSYIETVDDIDEKLKAGKDVKFAVILMDVNNLKATNDKYGHRFGCSLVVRCGHTLPTLFKSSKLFHIGGDEFLVVVQGEDLEHFEKTMENFDKAMLYSLVDYEGVELIFSVARGYKIRDKEPKFREVLQVADEKMYENKKYLKEKYNMKGR